jgi:hypothetical protein
MAPLFDLIFEKLKLGALGVQSAKDSNGAGV